MLAIGTDWAVVCADIIADPDERMKVMNYLIHGGRTVVKISPEQVNGFAGNVLEVRNASGEPCIAMSSAAYETFSAGQR